MKGADGIDGAPGKDAICYNGTDGSPGVMGPIGPPGPIGPKGKVLANQLINQLIKFKIV